MPEMPNVISNEVIESEWGNDIRDRTIQRYATAAERTSLHVSPVTGDLSYLLSDGRVYVYYSGSWRSVGGSEEVNGSQALTSPQAINTTLTARLSLTLAIPAHWLTWEATAQATGFLGLSAGTATFAIRIDGVDSASLSGITGSVFAVQGRQTGFSATGTRTISVMVATSTGGAHTIDDSILTARALRTT